MSKGIDDSWRSSKKYKCRRKILFWILIFVMCLVFVGVGYGIYFFSKIKFVVDNFYDNVRNGKVFIFWINDIEFIKDSFFILIIGVDISFIWVENGNFWSDLLILVIFNVKDLCIEMISILCDFYVYIEDFVKDIDKYMKINVVYVYGGLEFIMKIVEEEFKILIDYYVCFDFDVFLKIVDVLDGIDVDVLVDFIE